VLAELLQDALSDERIVHASHDDIVIAADGTVTVLSGLTWQDWLRHPDQANFDASIVLPMQELLGYSAQHLSEHVAQVFTRLFPLILLAITDDPISAIIDYLDLPPDKPEANPEYSVTQCAEDMGVNVRTLVRWVRAVERKGQAILYGPPGTGKTYVAERLARHLVAGADGFADLVQFHPAYAYEDFIQGIRPQSGESGSLEYSVVPGRFLEFCRKAKKRTGTCVLIIDEINRANLARVFGELMYLLEYRDREIPLASGGTLRIPPNVRIIGTMNTADRSIALVDHALRRRFAFLALYPNYDILRHYHQATGFNVEPLIGVLKKLNQQIGDRHYEVGITFFLREDLAEQIDDVWRMEIEPYLEEYFFDQSDKVEAFRWYKVEESILK
jgi:5-methylcytosine-specific restriction protein B